MTVSELIEALRLMPQDAMVVLEDTTAQPGPGVSRLRAEEVQRIELGWWESNGTRIDEVWRADGTMDGPSTAVLLGTLS